MANLKDLIVNGTARIIGKVYASEFVGNATSATNDSSNNKITDTYATKAALTEASGEIETLRQNKLDKVSYEYNGEVSFNGSGCLCIGKFPCSDTNITISIDNTSREAYHGTLVIATQNINNSGDGTLNAYTYGDVYDTLTPALKLEYNTGSNSINVYFQPASWSKTLIHIRCVNLWSSPTDILTKIDSIPSTADKSITNILKSALDGYVTSTTFAETIGDINSALDTINGEVV